LLRLPAPNASDYGNAPALVRVNRSNNRARREGADGRPDRRARHVFQRKERTGGARAELLKQRAAGTAIASFALARSQRHFALFASAPPSSLQQCGAVC